MRRYDDPVDVRKGRVQGSTGSVEGPEQFLWRGRLWKVRDGGRALGGDRALVAVRRGAGGDRLRGPARRGGPVATLTSPDLLAEREVWRVEASRGTRSPADGPGDRPGSGSSTWSSTGPTAAGGSSAAWTEGRDDDPTCTGRTRRVRPAGRHPLLPRPGRGVAARGDDRPPRCRPATPAPTSRRCGRPRRCWPPARHPAPGPRRRRAEERLGAARRGGPRARPSGRRSSPPARPSGRPPRRAPAGRSPSARPTTWSATPTGSSALVEAVARADPARPAPACA